MKHIIKRVSDREHTGHKKNLNTFQLDDSDLHRYSGRLFGFSHGTNAEGLRKILESKKIDSSFNIRRAQSASGQNTTGGDRGHDGQYTVYFRFVEKRSGDNPDTGIPKAVVRSLGGVGGGSGCVLFVSLEKVVRNGICFALAGGGDGIRGINCFTESKLAQSRISFYRNKQNYLNMQRRIGLTSVPVHGDGGDISDYDGDFSPVYLGKTQFELGLSAAESRARSNEIGFFDSIPLENVEIIMIRGRSLREISDYSETGTYSPRNSGSRWHIFLRNT